MVKLKVALEPGDDGEYSYFPGDLLNGFVALSLIDVQKLRGLYIELSGKARAHWTESNGKSSTNYEGVEVYLNSRTYLFGQSGGPSLEIQPGKHKYCFSLQLPSQIPYSLSIPHAEIWYKLKVNLDIPWAIDEQVKVPFTVLPRLDLSLYQELNNPCNFEQVEKLFSFGETRPLKICIMLPYTGLVSGEDFSFTTKLENQSKVDVLRTIVKLKQSITLYSNSDSLSKNKKKKNYEVISYVGGGAKAGISNHILARFRVPDIFVSNKNFCKVIVLSYYLKIELEVSGMNKNPEIEIPITIGTMRSENQEAQSLSPTNSSRMVNSSATENRNIAESSATSHKSDSPPPFEEALNLLKLDNPTSMQQSSPKNFGWNIDEKF